MLTGLFIIDALIKILLHGYHPLKLRVRLEKTALPE